MTSYLIRSEEGINYICSRDEVTGERTVLHTVELEYIDIGAGSYGYPHVGLSLWNDRLWFSDPDTVYSMKPDGSDVVTEFAYDAEGNGKHIYGCYVINDTLYMTLRNHEDERSTMELPLEASGYHTHSYTQEKIEPTCLENGVTVHTCSCGIQVESDHALALGHDYRITDEEEASVFDSGYTVYTCSHCNDSYLETIPQTEFSEWWSDGGSRTLVYFGAGILLIVSLVKKAKKK